MQSQQLFMSSWRDILLCDFKGSFNRLLLVVYISIKKAKFDYFTFENRSVIQFLSEVSNRTENGGSVWRQQPIVLLSLILVQAVQKGQGIHP